MYYVVPGILNTCTIYVDSIPEDAENFFLVEELPEGEGRILTDGKTLWREQEADAEPTVEANLSQMEAENKQLQRGARQAKRARNYSRRASLR